MNEKQNLIIDLKNISKSFNEVVALDSLNLSVKKNSIFGFLGPNGSGKTTTMKLMLGLLQPTSGCGKIFDEDIVKNNIQIRKRIGYLPQDIKLHEYMTSREILWYTARFYFKGPKNEIAKRVNEMLELVGLEDKADRTIRHFSGGEKQRLGIAQAQINHPDLLILDEPAAALDPLGRRDVLAILEKLREFTTVFYSTHILDDVERVSDAVAIINNGKLITQGSIEEILTKNEKTIFEASIKGDLESLKKRLTQVSWIDNVNLIKNNFSYNCNITVNDNNIAHRKLLRLILEDTEIYVDNFAKKHYNLEEIFMNLVEKESGVEA